MTSHMTRSLRSERHKVLRQLLVEARRGANLTQSELANKLDRPQSFVAKAETGERRLDVVEFLEIAAALKIDPAKIVKRLLKVPG